MSKVAVQRGKKPEADGKKSYPIVEKYESPSAFVYHDPARSDLFSGIPLLSNVWDDYFII